MDEIWYRIKTQLLPVEWGGALLLLLGGSSLEELSCGSGDLLIVSLSVDQGLGTGGGDVQPLPEGDPQLPVEHRGPHQPQV